MGYTFEITSHEVLKLKALLAVHDESCKFADPMKGGAIGGRLTYCFTNTSIGMITIIRCACGEEIPLTDFEEW